MKNNTKKGRYTLARPLASAAGSIAKLSSNSTCFCFTYQPNVPEKLRKNQKSEK